MAGKIPSSMDILILTHRLIYGLIVYTKENCKSVKLRDYSRISRIHCGICMITGIYDLEGFFKKDICHRFKPYKFVFFSILILFYCQFVRWLDIHIFIVKNSFISLKISDENIATSFFSIFFSALFTLLIKLIRGY